MTNITKRQDKVNATIERVKARLEKLLQMTEEQYSKKYKRDAFWLKFDIEHAQEQLSNNYEKLEEAKRLDAKEEEQLAKKNAKNDRLVLIPECLKAFGEEVKDATIADKIRIHKYLRSHKYPDFHDRSELANAIRRDRREWDEQKMRKDVERNVNDMLLNLIDRVEQKCGNIISTDRLFLNNGNSMEGIAINGWIEGDKGEAEVESIFAGGYNIQCLHVRVLVK